MKEQLQSLDYRSPDLASRVSVGRRVVFALAVLSAPAMLLTSLAALDGFFDPHSDFVFEGWAMLFLLSCAFPALSLTLRWRARRRA